MGLQFFNRVLFFSIFGFVVGRFEWSDMSVLSNISETKISDILSLNIMLLTSSTRMHKARNQSDPRNKESPHNSNRFGQS